MTKHAPLIAAAAAAAALALPATAAAATVSAADGTATYSAAAGEANHLTISRGPGTLNFTDSGASGMTAGVGCSPAGVQAVSCPSLAVSAISVDLGDGDDYLSEGFFFPISTPTTAFGGDGSDTLRTGSGDDTVAGGAGDDTISAGSGDDTIDPGEGADAVSGGSGTDTVTYATRTAGVTVTLGDGTANDGEAGEGDNLEATVNNVVGGEGDDQLTGTDTANELVGGAGADTLTGAGGDDVLDGGSGVDTYDGGAGADTIRARDGELETVGCGSEADTVEADYDDALTVDCETVDRSAPPPVVDPPPVVLPPPPAIDPPPVAAISAAPAALSDKGVVAVKLSCPSDAAGGCAGTITVKLLDGKPKATVAKALPGGPVSAERRRPKRGHRHFKIAPGKTKSITIKLARRAIRKLKGRKHAKALITVTMSTAGGKVTTTRVVALRRTYKKPKKKKHKH